MYVNIFILKRILKILLMKNDRLEDQEIG
jgi:hypothetical protein